MSPRYIHPLMSPLLQTSPDYPCPPSDGAGFSELAGRQYGSDSDADQHPHGPSGRDVPEPGHGCDLPGPLPGRGEPVDPQRARAGGQGPLPPAPRAGPQRGPHRNVSGGGE